VKRREFITLLGGVAAAWPLAARAQDNGRTYRLGFLLPTTRQSSPVEALFDELRLNGFVEGKNLTVVPGGFEATDDNLAQRAAALVNAAPDAIVAGPAPPLRALQAVTRSVPLLGMSEDMVGEGLVASLARPGGNITGDHSYRRNQFPFGPGGKAAVWLESDLSDEPLRNPVIGIAGC
jgi:putative tryptophan/tyrosine transport system substrate-binding protein